jgi:hypothetical protein
VKAGVLYPHPKPYLAKPKPPGVSAQLFVHPYPSEKIYLIHLFESREVQLLSRVGPFQLQIVELVRLRTKVLR